MSDHELSRRAYYMMAVQEALLALGGGASPQDVYDWLRKTGKAQAQDLEAQLKTGGSRFEKEVRFARMMLARGGLLSQPARGRWELTDSGRRTQLTAELSNELLKALHGVNSGDLDPERTYRAMSRPPRRAGSSATENSRTRAECPGRKPAVRCRSCSGA